MKRFKRLTFSFIAIYGLQMMFSTSIEGANADGMFIFENSSELRQLKEAPAPVLKGLQENNAELTLKQWGR